ncbi:carboxypeptidase S [Abortiporus biennis]|nr:carboxypeptidase S [Abortiporus biennis]
MARLSVSFLVFVVASVLSTTGQASQLVGRLPRFDIPDQVVFGSGPTRAEASHTADLCPQAQPLSPSKHADLTATLYELYVSDKFKNRTYEALIGAVRVPSESYDIMGPVGEDPRYEIFSQLHDYFKAAYPLIHSTLNLTKVNTFGLLYQWQGSDPSLQPILLTGHQDVVPINPATLSEWIHPPYAGHYDGTWIWGRGSCDDKASVTSILSSIEALISHGFKPARTIVLAFGFDEESAGYEGAGHLAAHLEELYDKDSFAALLDEGSGYLTTFGEDTIFAVPSTSEKGQLDIKLEIATLGGHSSVPPPHTGIGILSAAIVEIESNPHTPGLHRQDTSYATFQCVAEHGPNIPQQLRVLARKADEDDEALEDFKKLLLSLDPVNHAIMATTQAVDIIQGGVKANALPEVASAVINHRIAEYSSIEELQQHLTSVLLPIAQQFDLTLISFGENKTVAGSSGKGGHMNLSFAFGSGLQPSPSTPIGTEDIPYQILSGTIKATLKNSTVFGDKNVVIAPMLAIGNTDTRFYWNLTRHIFRYVHFNDEDMYNGAHTVNEAIRAEALIDAIKFYTTFVLNWDESSA